MKNFTKILTTSAVIGAVSIAATTTANAASNRSLEKRIAKIEQKLKAAKSGKIGDYSIFGRLQFDKVFVDGKDSSGNEIKDSSGLRRGRLGVKGKLSHGWSFKSEFDFADKADEGKDESRVVVTDAYLAKKMGKASLKIGQYKEPFSLEELTSSRFVTFNERASTVNAYVPGRNMGVSYNLHLDGINFSTGLFGDNVSDKTASGKRDTLSFTSRLATYASLGGKDVIHFGVAYRSSEPSVEDAIATKFKPDASIDQAGTVAKISDSSLEISRIQQTGLELAIVKGRTSIQGEYVHSNIDGTDYDNLEGYYGQISLFLTDDQRNYKTKSSAFGRVKPNGDNGAVELAYRFGKARNAGLENHTVGLNWYATNNIRFSANYVKVDVDTANSAVQYQDDAEIVALRAQVDF